MDNWHCTFASATSSDSSIDYAKNNTAPDVILMDYQLGRDVNGLDLIDAIRQHLDIVIPASLVTATHDEDLVTRCKEQGVNYLSKPIKPAKLRALLKSMTRHIKQAH